MGDNEHLKIIYGVFAVAIALGIRVIAQETVNAWYNKNTWNVHLGRRWLHRSFYWSKAALDSLSRRWRILSWDVPRGLLLLAPILLYLLCLSFPRLPIWPSLLTDGEWPSILVISPTTTIWLWLFAFFIIAVLYKWPSWTNRAFRFEPTVARNLQRLSWLIPRFVRRPKWLISAVLGFVVLLVCVRMSFAVKALALWLSCQPKSSPAAGDVTTAQWLMWTLVPWLLLTALAMYSLCGAVAQVIKTRGERGGTEEVIGIDALPGVFLAFSVLLAVNAGYLTFIHPGELLAAPVSERITAHHLFALNDRTPADSTDKKKPCNKKGPPESTESVVPNRRSDDCASLDKQTVIEAWDLWIKNNFRCALLSLFAFLLMYVRGVLYQWCRRTVLRIGKLAGRGNRLFLTVRRLGLFDTELYAGLALAFALTLILANSLIDLYFTADMYASALAQ